MLSGGIKASNVLIVDDVVDNLNMLADLLQDQGHAVHIALSGQAALDVVADKRPDLILLDIQMPGMDGYEVCERVKADETTRDIPVIFLSAHADTTDILKGFEVGGIDYIGKPFQFREVVARVQSQLALSQQRQEIERLRERDRQQFEQLTRMKDTFLHTTAHDLKNPLAGVLLYSQMLKELEASEINKLAGIATGIEQSARKMQRLITDMLDLAQMQIGEPLLLMPADMHDVLGTAIKNFEVMAQEKEIDLKLAVPEEAVSLQINKSQFERVLDNLISNAIKYTSDDGEVVVSLELFDDHAAIAIRDTGLGIPEDDLPHIFEAFYRVRKPTHKKMAGTGLGLSIVQAIVEQHYGEISAESELGKGSTFIVRLPRQG